MECVGLTIPAILEKYPMALADSIAFLIYLVRLTLNQSRSPIPLQLYEMNDELRIN
jgi:hypothetical protein